MSKATAAELLEANQVFIQNVRFNRALGLRITELEHLSELTRLEMQLPSLEDFIGDPVERTLHGGVITAALDAACGGAVVAHVSAHVRVATLDLRVNTITSAAAGYTIVFRAECFHEAEQVAFARGQASVEGKTIATATGSFMLFRDVSNWELSL